MHLFCCLLISCFMQASNNLMSTMVRGVALSRDLRESINKAFETGLSSYKIAKQFNLPRSSIRNIISKFKNSGNVEIGKKTGRPPIAKPRDCRVLKKIIKENRRQTAAAITVQWRERIKKSVSVDTCKRTMKKIGYKFYKVCFRFI